MITPQIIDLTEDHVIYQKYDYDLLDFLLANKENKTNLFPIITEQIVRLTQKLHSIEIIHGDLHSCNIVVNYDKVNNIVDVRLIDFNMSKKLSEITQRDLLMYSSLYGSCNKINSIDELKQLEVNIAKRICNNF